jgi:hypothetical protein
MASPQILQRLKPLKAPSGRRLSESIIAGMTQSFTQARYQLMHSTRGSGGGIVHVPRAGALDNPKARRKLMTIQTGPETGFTMLLNDGLLGGESYPVLNAVLGTVAGAASAGAGLIFTVMTTALDVSRTTQRVLARSGDELWQVEEIGKTNDGAVVHVGSYFLSDPFRQGAAVKGWLIHEERHTLTV